jgi:ATP-dependent Zn protease
MEFEEDELTAYHEAGHVVMALQTGGTIVRASIEPPDDDGPNRYGETITSWRQITEAETCRAEIAVSLGGPVAEMIYTNEMRDLESVPEWHADWQRVLISAVHFSNHEAKARRMIEQSKQAVHSLLDSENGWAAVAAIADLLLTHDTVEHEQCQETVGFWLRR